MRFGYREVCIIKLIWTLKVIKDVSGSAAVCNAPYTSLIALLNRAGVNRQHRQDIELLKSLLLCSTILLVSFCCCFFSVGGEWRGGGVNICMSCVDTVQTDVNNACVPVIGPHRPAV